MNRAAVIRRRTAGELVSQHVTRWLGGVLLALAVAAVILVLGRWHDRGSLVDALIAMAGVTPAFLVTLLYVGGPLARDQVNRTVTSLMATPTTPRELTRGTTMALVELAWPLAVLTPIALGLAHGDLSGSPALLVVALVLTPALGWGTVWLTIGLALTRGVETALAVTWLVGLFALVVVPGGIMLGWFDVTGWAFAAGYAVVVALIWLWVWALDATATRPRLAAGR